MCVRRLHNQNQNRLLESESESESESRQIVRSNISPPLPLIYARDDPLPGLLRIAVAIRSITQLTRDSIGSWFMPHSEETTTSKMAQVNGEKPSSAFLSVRARYPSSAEPVLISNHSISTPTPSSPTQLAPSSPTPTAPSQSN